MGGRAAVRAERQAAEAARKKAGKRAPAGPGEPTGPGRAADPDEERRPGTPRRAVQALLAVVVVALVVLGLWSFTSPAAEETAAQTPATSSAPATSAPAAPSPAESAPPSAEATPTPTGPVRAPITVLNSTGITGLAGDIGDQLSAGGWEVLGTAGYPGSDVAVTTVYFTKGDVQQEQAATQLIEQFPDLTGPAPRFFDVPGVASPGLVVVATGNWRP